jgi:hypothetical protein
MSESTEVTFCLLNGAKVRLEQLDCNIEDDMASRLLSQS